MTRILTALRKVVRPLGIDIVRLGRAQPLPPDFDAFTRHVYSSVREYTMTTPERIAAVVEGVRYVCRAGIRGDLVECGVWRGGSTMAMLMTLQDCGSTRNVHLYDTFEGMTEPGEADVGIGGDLAREHYERSRREDPDTGWCKATLEEVRANMRRTGYPLDRLEFIAGRVEDTIPRHLPAEIALLRLDTDWYESTSHELEHLFPRLTRGGVLIVDDYGHWAGARRAVDEYFERNGVKMFLSRSDYTGRIGVKLTDTVATT